jgi:phosphatidylglycerophosphate synthase
MTTPSPETRRPLATRQAAWAHALSSRLAQSSITANQISVASIGFAALGAALLAYPAGSIPLAIFTLVVAALCTQLRLLCNLLDGMVAVEGGKSSPTGVLYNELPDRLADSLLIVALGYGCGLPAVGWFGALAAALTAYIRQTGAGLGLGQDFSGIQSKPKRMFVLTLGCVLGAFELGLNGSMLSLKAACWFVALGSVITCITRTRTLSAKLVAKAQS